MPVDNRTRQRLLGDWGEEAVCAWLKRHRYKVLARNFRCRLGEIDIIAANRDYIAFVEVKLRRDADFARALEAVTPAKQRRILMTAELYLQKYPTELQPRFDVAEVYAPEGMTTSRPEINYLEDAFES